MAALIGWVLAGLATWGLLFAYLDRPAIPAWQTRTAYRLLVAVLLVLLVGVGMKAVAWRTELRSLVAGCR